MRRTVLRRLAPLLLVLLVLSLGAAGCQSKPNCVGTLNEYNGMCLTNTAIVYMECTKGRGFDTSEELSGSLGGTFKVVADASISLARKSSQKENQEVSLRIVNDCLKIAESAADSPADRAIAQDQQAQVDGFLEQLKAKQVKETPHITVSPSVARVGDSITVSGTNYYANETVAVRLHTTVLAQVVADADGSFTTTVEVPQSAPPPSFPSSVVATGETSAKSAQIPLKIVE
ncbi:MAG: hypothetical protein WAR57_13200 [Candidatus Phosphoribacter sp.]